MTEIIALSMTVGIGLGIYLLVLRPMSQLSGAMVRMSAGQTGVMVPGTARRDEFGTLAREIAASAAQADSNRVVVTTVSDMLRAAEAGNYAARSERTVADSSGRAILEGLDTLFTNLETAFDSVAAVMSRLAAGDLTASRQARLPGRFGEILDGAEAARQSLVDLATRARQGTGALTGQLQTMSDSMGQLSQRTESSAAALEQSAAALTELSDGAATAADRAREAEAFVDGARSGAERTTGVVQEMIGAMSDIRTSSEAISSIVDLIESIAFQTNLLALNAGVEAARAGDSGRGFAVVASEVRALATRASQAASDIGKLIASSRAQVVHGVALVETAGGAIAEITGAIGSINGIVTKISDLMREQSNGIGEISRAVRELDRTTQQNAAMVQSTSESSTELLDEAARLGQTVARFRIEAEAARQDDFRLAG